MIPDNVLFTNFANNSICRVFANLLNYPARCFCSWGYGTASAGIVAD